MSRLKSFKDNRSHSGAGQLQRNAEACITGAHNNSIRINSSAQRWEGVLSDVNPMHFNASIGVFLLFYSALTVLDISVALAFEPFACYDDCKQL